jgi:hypothetical protein
LETNSAGVQLNKHVLAELGWPFVSFVSFVPSC